MDISSHAIKPIVDRIEREIKTFDQLDIVTGGSYYMMCTLTDMIEKRELEFVGDKAEILKKKFYDAKDLLERDIKNGKLTHKTFRAWEKLISIMMTLLVAEQHKHDDEDY